MEQVIKIRVSKKTGEKVFEAVSGFDNNCYEETAEMESVLLGGAENLKESKTTDEYYNQKPDDGNSIGLDF